MSEPLTIILDSPEGGGPRRFTLDAEATVQVQDGGAAFPLGTGEEISLTASYTAYFLDPAETGKHLNDLLKQHAKEARRS